MIDLLTSNAVSVHPAVQTLMRVDYTHIETITQTLHCQTIPTPLCSLPDGSWIGRICDWFRGVVSNLHVIAIVRVGDRSRSDNHASDDRTGA